jgi:hypothetical protein
MSKSNQQFNHARKYARDIKRLYSINTAVKILETNDSYFLTNETNFKTQINQKDFINLTK